MAQANEALRHTDVVIIQSMHELGIEPAFRPNG